MRIDSCGFLNMEGSRYLTDSKLDGSLVDIMQVTSVAPWFNDKKDMLEYLSLCRRPASPSPCIPRPSL
jgi:hypothetical protein